MAHADWITTVSPGYAAEIQSPAFGCGLESYLASRAARLRGILNGIDPAVWNPSTDAAVEARFSISSIDGRRHNKAALQRELGLPEQTRVPLLAMVTRLDGQKGVDLALEGLALLTDKDWQMVLLGTGDAALEECAQVFAASRPEKVVFLPRFDPLLSRRIYAGADMILVPSRYEPCGLVQLIALRYGAVPVVHATGGLKDTVGPYHHGGKGTGFLFDSVDPQSLADSLRQAMAVYADRRRWLGLQHRGMAQDYSWGRSAQAYLELYGEAVALRHPASRGAA
jgi:starch synthase